MTADMQHWVPTRSGRRASQHPFEIFSFINLLQERGVKRYLEIGSRHGDTFYLVTASLPEGSRAVAVDLPGGPWGVSSSMVALQRAGCLLEEQGYKTSVLFGSSHTEEMRASVARMGPYDAVLIDGDHTLEGVTKDWELYGNMAPIVAFHDIVGTGQFSRENEVQVPILWERLKKDRLYREFVGYESKMGIGVVFNA